MDARLQASINLKAILPLMEDLVEGDPAAAAAVAGEDLVLQFQVWGGPAAHLAIDRGRVQYGTGVHPRPDLALFFVSAGHLNRLFAGETVLPGIRKGFRRLGFLTNGFPILAERLSYHLEGEGQSARGPEADRFLVRLGLHAMLGGMVAVAADDRSLAHVAAATSAGTLLVRVLPDGPQGSFTRRPEAGRFSTTWQESVQRPNAVMEFESLEVARQIIDGELGAVTAVGTGQIAVRGYLPLIEKANIFLDRFSRLMGR
jgi:hypothetical protein